MLIVAQACFWLTECGAGFTEAKEVTEVELPSQSLTGFASLQAKFSRLVSKSSQQDPFYAVLAYKQQL